MRPNEKYQDHLVYFPHTHRLDGNVCGYTFHDQSKQKDIMNGTDLSDSCYFVIARGDNYSSFISMKRK